MKPSIIQAVSSLPPSFSNIPRPNADGHACPLPEPCPLPDYPTAVKLSNAYFQNIHPQYPFLHEPSFRAWETVLEDPLEAMSTLGYNPVPLYFLNMVPTVPKRVLKRQFLTVSARYMLLGPFCCQAWGAQQSNSMFPLCSTLTISCAMTTWNAFKLYYAVPPTLSDHLKAHRIGNLSWSIVACLQTYKP